MSAGVCGWSKKEGKVNGDLEKFSFFFSKKTLHTDQSKHFVIFLNTSHTNLCFEKKEKKNTQIQ